MHTYFPSLRGWSNGAKDGFGCFSVIADEREVIVQILLNLLSQKASWDTLDHGESGTDQRRHTLLCRLQCLDIDTKC